MQNEVSNAQTPCRTPTPRRARGASVAKLAHSAHALAGKLNAGVILGLVGGLASLSFVVEFLRDILKPPDWTLNLSIFHVYGQPMANGANWTGTVVMLGLALALLASGTYRFARADVSN